MLRKGSGGDAADPVFVTSLKRPMLPAAGGAGDYVVSLAACHLVRAISFLNDYSEALNRASVYKRVRLK